MITQTIRNTIIKPNNNMHSYYEHDNPLIFIGYGSGSNPKLGSNSAIMQVQATTGDMRTILFEAGESNWRSLMNMNAYHDAKHLTILISHTHSDHAGNLGSLLNHRYHKLHHEPTILIAADDAQYVNIMNLLHGFGVSNYCYKLINIQEMTPFEAGEAAGIMNTQLIMPRTTHDDMLSCHNIELILNENSTDDNITSADAHEYQHIYWSGDTNTCDNAMHVIMNEYKKHENIDNLHVYHEIRTDGNPHHTDLHALNHEVMRISRSIAKLMLSDEHEKKHNNTNANMSMINTDDGLLISNNDMMHALCKQIYLNIKQHITVMHVDSDDTLNEAMRMGYMKPVCYEPHDAYTGVFFDNE